MEQSDKIFGVPCTTSALTSFSGLAQLSSNPFAAVATTAAFVFGQSPVFAATTNAATSSTSIPFATFNFSAPSFTPQSSAFSFTISAGEPSYQSTAKSQDSSDVQLLFGKPVYDEPKTEQSEQEVKSAQTSQLEPRRRWNAKPGKYLTSCMQKCWRFLCLC